MATEGEEGLSDIELDVDELKETEEKKENIEDETVKAADDAFQGVSNTALDVSNLNETEEKKENIKEEKAKAAGDVFQGQDVSKIKELEAKKDNINKEINSEKKDNINEKRIMELKNKINTEIDAAKAFSHELQLLLEGLEKTTILKLQKAYSKTEATLVQAPDRDKGTSPTGEPCQQSETPHFTPDQGIKHYLEKLQGLGSISSRSELENESNNKLNSETEMPITPAPKQPIFKVKVQRQIDVKVDNDQETCNILGSCFTDDGDLLLTDSRNRSIKRLDRSTDEIKDYIHLHTSPHAICIISQTEAGVTTSDHSLKFVSLQNKMVVTRTLTMKHICWGLAYVDGKLFISDGAESVYIYDTDGRQLKQISTHISGNHIFQGSMHIAVARDRVFVADGDKCLVILDLEGNYLCTLDIVNILTCYTVCTDDRNIFVSGHRSNNVVQLGHDFRLLGEIAKFDSPLSLSFDKHNKTLCATGHSDKVMIFQLQ